MEEYDVLFCFLKCFVSKRTMNGVDEFFSDCFTELKQAASMTTKHVRQKKKIDRQT